MKISIITIGLNNKNEYEKTLSSIVAQTNNDYELIVVDGSSTDGSLDTIKSFSSHISHLISEKDSGIYNAMNKGIKKASGDYCLFLNSGDTFHDTNVLQRVHNELSDADFYSGHIQRFNAKKRWVNKAPKHITAYYLIQKALHHPATFIRTQLLKERPYDENYKIVADWEEMVYELLLRNRSYQQLDFIISDFNTEGISSNPNYKNLLAKERSQVLRELFTPRIVEALSGTNKFERRILYALSKENKWKRNIKILRNVLKAIPKDFSHLFLYRRI